MCKGNGVKIRNYLNLGEMARPGNDLILYFSLKASFKVMFVAPKP